jgi:regulator of PEP synthase PpsR (kinase-PPPase family)
MAQRMKKPKPRTTRRRAGTERADASAKGTQVLHVLSDSTGNLARHMLAALLTQYPPNAVSLKFHTFLRTELRLDEALKEIAANRGPVCHAVVAEPFKQRIVGFCRKAKLPHHDLTGGTVEFLTRVTGVEPHNNPATLHQIDESYKRRIGALEYTLGHDDALGLETIGEADIVLAGVSRTGKTPTSIYLAQQGYRVANVALAMEVPPPKELLALPPRKVVGLVISPQQLSLIRNRREQEWQMTRTSYGEPAHVSREIAWARQLFARQNWPVLDVTDQAIEETAAKVVDLLGLGGGPKNHKFSGDLP